MRQVGRILVIAFLLLFFRPAGAAPGTDEKARERAFQLTKAGVDLQKEGKHELALDALTEAAQVFDHPKILFYKARSLTALERWQEAFELWDRLMGQGGLKDKQLVAVREGWVRCKQELKEDTKGGASSQEAAPKSAGGALAAPLVLPPSRPTPRVVVPEQSATVTTKDSARGRRTLGWSLVGGGGALGVGGAALLVQWAVQKSKQEPGKHLEGEGLAIGLGASLTGVGLAAAGAGLYVLLTGADEPGDGPGSSAFLVPLGAKGIGVSWQGRF